MATSNPKCVTPATARRLSILGDAMLVRLTGADTNGAMAVFEQHTNPGGGVPTHTHDREDELFQILVGTVQFVVGGKEIVAPTGSTVWAPRGVPHSFKVIGDMQAKLLVAVTPSGLEHMFEELGALPPGPPDFPKVAAICARHGVRFA